MDSSSRSGGHEPPSLFPPVILNLLIANGLFYGLQIFFTGPSGEPSLLQVLGMLYPWGHGFQPWQLVTYGFLHDPRTLNHLLFNMLALWMFGRDLELRWGSLRFLVFYFLSVIGAGLTNLLYMKFTGHLFPVLGASGGTFAILLAFGMMFPNRIIVLLIPPIPMKAKHMVMLFGALELFLGASGYQTGVAHFAHLGGLVTGLALIFFWRQRGVVL